jgi:uncharacterized membrane protein (UPF0127 family)
MIQILRLALLLLLVAVPARAQQIPPVFKTGTISIATAGGSQRFTVERATTDEQREYGLMYRRKLPADAGMVFVYPDEREVAMWMKNTLIPLDMLFVKADGTILSIRERAVPLSEETIPSKGPVEIVVELNGGTVSRLGIKPGDKITGDALAP